MMTRLTTNNRIGDEGTVRTAGRPQGSSDGLYLLTGILAVPVYTTVIGTAGDVVYLETPPWSGGVLLYEHGASRR